METSAAVPSVPPATLLRRLAEAPEGDPRDALRAFLERRTETTARAYRADLETLRGWLALPSLDAVGAALCAAHPRRLAELVLSWAKAQRAAGLSPATVLRRVSTVRSLVSALRRAGCTTNVVDIDARELAEAAGRRGTSRDVSGPSLGEAGAMLERAAAQRDPVLAARDVALLWCLVGLGLRRAEVASLRVDELELDAGDRCRARILGKARDSREWITVPPDVADALRRWLAVRPVVDHAAVFVALDRPHRAAPPALTGSTVYVAVRRIAARAGVAPSKSRPHGLRHTHGTQAARLTNGDAFAVRASLRHASVATSMRYVDDYDDRQGKVAGLVAAAVRAAR